MDHYVKTDLGIQALKQRSFQLNARQRQLLLLIGTDDFRILNSAMKQRLATPEIVQQLEQLGLIIPNQLSPNHTIENMLNNNNQVVLDQQVVYSKNTHSVVENECKENKQPNKNNEFTDHSIIHQQKESESAAPQPIQNKNLSQINDTLLNFEEVKQTMMGLLKLHCGLMAKQLILKIQHAQSVREIKLCQMQWITALQETRIPRDELNLNMQQINRSLQHMCIS
ncbi:hypothetical protein [Acinetobacter piscicola]|uniref:hypothetical protein n=1 Tax=Acinetobacter piscicola TaxID=2006115 RepID=UPI000B7FDC66|nr:hypothetical protein [Acinetobacter piscicola]